MQMRRNGRAQNNKLPTIDMRIDGLCFLLTEEWKQECMRVHVGRRKYLFKIGTGISSVQFQFVLKRHDEPHLRM